MLCEICGKNPAVIRIQEMTNSQKKVLHICQACAESKSMMKEIHNEFDLAKLMVNISPEIINKLIQKDIVMPPSLSCQSCGWDIVKFTNVGRLGCADCFKIFRPILSQAIKNMHKGSMHVGKKPGLAKNIKDAEDQPKITQMMELQQKLDEYVKREEYEKAAEMRDKLAELRKTIVPRNSARKKA